MFLEEDGGRQGPGVDQGSGDEIRAVFFDMWLTDHPDADLEKVPADMVMASGSGLDPHITLDNAIWQLDHFPIAAAWAKPSGRDEAKVREEIRQILRRRVRPLGRPGRRAAGQRAGSESGFGRPLWLAVIYHRVFCELQSGSSLATIQRTIVRPAWPVERARVV